MRTGLFAGLVVLAFAGSAAASSGPQYSAHVTNHWFPLLPGSGYVYRGYKDGKPARDFMVVTHRTRVIRGARCVVVSDRLYLRGRLAERTTDWYTQDRAGNVWYFGERTAELAPNGHVLNTTGTWTAGVHGARPGIYMPAHPHRGKSGQQEYYKGQAEDHYAVVGLGERASVPFVSSRHALLTKEWTPLEPGTLDHKFYVRGIGVVLEQTVKGGSERGALVSFHRGS